MECLAGVDVNAANAADPRMIHRPMTMIIMRSVRDVRILRIDTKRDKCGIRRKIDIIPTPYLLYTIIILSSK